MPGWRGSDRRSRLPADWATRRRRVLRRDRYRCQHREPGTGQLCGMYATEVDHIDRGDDHAEENLQALCTDHHRSKSGREGAQAAQQKRRATRQKFRRTEDHPGLL